ncbi:MAG TPA: antitoxin [Spirochaetota bacterium]|nr:antitoxin [Spirochaetota bacterium]HOR44944.1 antitoxin [Spirochaetota bacterium]HPJ13475.1 antitoxin [Spirochaetota bacterium]HPK56948.1 antitoxin [Spirochaetota bacterium]HPM33408.1 antitoxin [Spirochaetota bacterium]
MKTIIDKDEKELINSIENEEWVPVKNAAELKKIFKKAARTTSIKDQRMNIRIAKRYIQSLKAKALEEGMPYQTLVSSILHKYITGKLTEKNM